MGVNRLVKRCSRLFLVMRLRIACHRREGFPSACPKLPAHGMGGSCPRLPAVGRGGGRFIFVSAKGESGGLSVPKWRVSVRGGRPYTRFSII